MLRYYAEEGRRIWGSTRPSVRSDVRNVVMYQPVGVVGAIVPWNYPVDLYCWKVAPALAAGCPVIVKPPEQTPLAVGRVAELLTAAGLPPGVLSDLPGPGRGSATRSSATLQCGSSARRPRRAPGRRSCGAPPTGMKRVSLELGGHTPFVVLHDGDVEAAAAAAARRSFSNMGQICIAVNRVLVDTACHDEFVDALAASVSSMRIGHGVDAGVEYGPVLDEAVRERAAAHIADARGRGGSVVVGRRAPDR